MSNRTGRAWRAVTVGVAGVVAASGCVAPSPDRGAFTQNAVAALGSATSQTRTASLALRADLAGRSSAAYANTVVTASEAALGPIQSSFGNVDPPVASQDQLREQVMGMLGDAADACAAARIAVRRQDRSQMAAQADELARLADRMEAAKEALG